MYCLLYCFIYSLYLLVSDRYYVDVANFRNLQDPQEEDFEQLLVGNQGKCSLTMLILYALSL
jgi:hypothetical protein